MIPILLFLLGIVGISVFVKYRPKSYPSMLLPKQKAIELAGAYIKKLCGIDVVDWKAYGMYWYDRETINRLHQLHMLNKLRSTLFSWGLIESWRIRFVSENKSIIIGINSKLEVTFLHVDVRSGEMKAQYEIKSAEDVKKLLHKNDGGIWEKAEINGEGIRTEDFSNIITYWYTVQVDTLRLKLSVQIQNGCILRILTDTEILTSSMAKVIRKEFRESALNMSGFVGSFLAGILGVLLLIYSNGPKDTIISLVLLCIVVTAVLLTVKEDIYMSVVNTYDSRLTVYSVYIIGIMSAITSSIAYGCVVFITSLAGTNIAIKLSIPMFSDLLNQTLAGTGVAFLCLGGFSIMYRMLESRGVMQISPELSDRSYYLSGFSFKQSLSISLQSSISEEVIFRLLGISTFIWFFQNEFLAVSITSILWALLHSGSGYNPGWIRQIQLVILGIILGYTFLIWGFFATVIAHFLHNFIVISMPLIYYLTQKKQGTLDEGFPQPSNVDLT